MTAPAGLTCAACPVTAEAVRVNGIWSDPAGWSNVSISGTPITCRVLCPGCTAEVRRLIGTPPLERERAHDAELEAAFTRGYTSGAEDRAVETVIG